MIYPSGSSLSWKRLQPTLTAYSSHCFDLPGFDLDQSDYICMYMTEYTRFIFIWIKNLFSETQLLDSASQQKLLPRNSRNFNPARKLKSISFSLNFSCCCIFHKAIRVKSLNSCCTEKIWIKLESIHFFIVDSTTRVEHNFHYHNQTSCKK